MRSVEKLTGNWFLKRRFFGGYDVMVEVNCYFIDIQLDSSPQFHIIRKAKDYEIVELNIKCV